MFNTGGQRTGSCWEWVREGVAPSRNGGLGVLSPEILYAKRCILGNICAVWVHFDVFNTGAEAFLNQLSYYDKILEGTLPIVPPTQTHYWGTCPPVPGVGA